MKRDIDNRVWFYSVNILKYTPHFPSIGSDGLVV